MSDDLGKKLKQITDLLGQENMPDNIKGLLSLLTSSAGKEEPLQKANELPARTEERSTRSEMDENIEMIRKVKTIMDRLNNTSDPRVNLLSAVRPFLNEKRQKKVSSCIKILQMASLTKLMDDN